MSRTPRHFPSQGIFHVLARGNNRMELFHRSADYLAYLGILGDALKDFPVALHHYCLMPNHVHLLISAGPPASVLSHLMHKVQLSYAIYYKAHHEHIGHLWQDRFKSLWINTERYFLVCAAYIELNPVAAGIVGHPQEYPYSSYHQYALGITNPRLTLHPLYGTLGSAPAERQRAYQALVEERIPRRVEDHFTVGFRVGMGGRPPKKGTGTEPSLFPF